MARKMVTSIGGLDRVTYNPDSTVIVIVPDQNEPWTAVALDTEELEGIVAFVERVESGNLTEDDKEW